MKRNKHIIKLAVMLMLVAGICHSQSAYSQETFKNFDLPVGTEVRDLNTDVNDLLVATNSGFAILETSNGFNWKKFTMDEGLPSNDIKSIGVSSSGVIKLGTADEHIATYENNKWTSDYLNTTSAYDYVSHMKYFDNQWIMGTDQGGVFEVKGTSVQKKPYSAPLGEVTSINKTSFGTLTILTTNGIMLDFNGTPVYINESSALPSNNVMSGAMSNDISYDGTDKGLYVADFSGGGAPTVSLKTTADTDIPSNYITALAAHGNTIWVGTDNGLAKWDGANNWVVYNTSNSNLPSNEIEAIAISDNQTVWIATKGGKISTLSSSLSVSQTSLNNQLTVYPNPSQGNFTLELPENFSGSNVEIEVLNSVGQVVLRESYSYHAGEAISTNISHLKKGIYHLRLESTEYNYTKKIILE